MSSDHTSELFPILEDDGREFETTMRGYDRRQVDSYLARTEAELAALTGERDSALNRSADLAAQLANSHAEIESLRRRLVDTAVEVTPENVHARVRPIVELAQAEARGIRESVDREASHLRMLADADAAETRRQAAHDAERMRAQAQADLQRATDAAAQREHEADEILNAARAEIAERHDRVHREAELLLGDARAEVQALTAQANAERERLDSAASAMRVRANEDFEIALRVRRSHEQKLDDERHAAAVAQSARISAEAGAEAQRMVAEASAHAQRMVAEATADSEGRIAEANARVNQLVELRRRVQADLDSVHGRLGQVLAHVAEAAEDHARPDPTATDDHPGLDPAAATPATAAARATPAEPAVP